jgi:lysophospholipid acyltransferase (LPLAT)-like uncharacterized protein
MTPLDRTSSAILTTVKVLGPTWRIRCNSDAVTGTREAKGSIFCFWHEYLLPVFYFHRHSGMHVVVSTSRDGKRLAAVLERWNYPLIRGSSTKGSENVLKESVDRLDKGATVAITPDGPRGPRREAKRGVALIALRAHVPIVPVAVDVRWAVRLLSWDRFALPLPFAGIDIRYGAPIEAQGGGEEQAVPHVLALVQKALTQ